MRSELHEIRRLEKLLKTPRLTTAEREAIEQNIRGLKHPDTGAKFDSGTLGVFDRPEPVPEPATEPELDSPPVEPSSPAPAEESAESTTPTPPKQELTPEQAEALCGEAAAIAEHIADLRKCWAVNLSMELYRESERWLVKLQEVAKRLPTELLEVALGDNVYMLRQTPRPEKSSIPERTQLIAMPPSAPSLDTFDTLSDFYFMLRERRPAPVEHPPGLYLPDGLGVM